MSVLKGKFESKCIIPQLNIQGNPTVLEFNG